MRQSFEFRAIIGVLIWIGIVAGGIIFARQSFNRAPSATTQLLKYVGKQRHVVELDFSGNLLLKIGDPVFLPDSDQVAPIGYVSRVEVDDRYIRQLAYATKATVCFFGTAPEIREGDVMEYHEAPDTAAWVLKTMLPPAKREEIGALILEAFREHQDEIVAELRPVVEASLKDAASVIREDIKAAFQARENQIRKIGQRYQSDLIEKEIVPLIQQEIWPVVREESEPLAGEVGNEIWKEVSMFRFGWRYLYDKTPLPDRKLTEKEFKRFADEKAIPILESHMGDFVELQKRLIRRIAANPVVNETVSKSLKKIVQDPEVQDLISEVFREVIMNNSRLKEVLEERWSGPQAKYAMAMTNYRLEPTIRDIGISLFGTPQGDITPEFAKVVRHRILHKDSRWFTLVQPKTRADSMSLRTLPLPKSLPVQIATTESEIPYLPSRERN
jgi:hypothetical protein